MNDTIHRRNKILIEIYSKPGCHLCEEAKEVITKAKEQFDLEIKEINIEEDDELLKKYGVEIPVIWINSRKAYKYRIDSEELHRRLLKEQSSGN